MPPPTPKKSKSTTARTSDPEPMKGLTPIKPAYMTPKKETVGSPDYSPAKEVDLGEELTEGKKGEMAEIGSRQEKFEQDLGLASVGKGRKSRKHKKSKKSRKTRKVKKHGKRRH
jgi:hypothetical protein